MAINLKQITLAIVCITLLLFSTSAWPQLKPVYALQFSVQPATKLLASSDPSPFFLPPSASSSNSQGNVTNSTTGAATGAMFQPYENSTYGIKIQYPSNWTKQESQNQGSGEIVKFSSPRGTTPVQLRISEGQRLPQNMSLEQWSNATINGFNQSFTKFTLIDSNSTTLAGFPAHKIVYTAIIPSTALELKFMQILTIKDSKTYLITYGTLPTDFSTYLPSIQTMINSFAFIPVTTPASAIPSNTTTTPTTHFLTYQNPAAGFKVNYASSWLKSENISANGSVVYFQEPLLDARFVVLSHKLPQGSPTNESKNIFFSAMLNAFTQQLQSYNPLRSISTTIAGSPANKTEFTFMSHGQEAGGIVLFSIIGDKFYLLSYGAAKYSYPVLLPIAQEMIDSFSPITGATSAAAISPSINATSTASPMAGPAQKSSNNTYTNATDGISVTIPQGWTTAVGQNQANATLLTVVTLSPPISLDPNALMNVNVYKATQPQASGVDQYARLTLNNLRGTLQDFKLVAPITTNITLSGNLAFQIAYSYTDPSRGPVEDLGVATLLKGNGYVILYSGSPTLFSTFLPQAQQVIKSVNLQPPS
jgi:hypothetical protein